MCLSESGCIQWENVEFDLTKHRCVAHTRHSECLDAGGAECDLGCLGSSFLSPQQSFTVQRRAEFIDHFITVTLGELTWKYLYTTDDVLSVRSSVQLLLARLQRAAVDVQHHRHSI